MKLSGAVLSAAFALTTFAALAADYPAPKQGDWIARDFKVHTGQVMPELRLHYTTIGQPTGQPVLVLHGADDTQPEKSSRMYAEAFPNAQFKVIDGATHFPFEEQPAVFAKIVGDFLAGLH